MAITSWGGGNSSDNLRRSVLHNNNGGVAQMVERSLSMREVPGSIPGASIPHFKLILDSYILSIKVGSIFTHKLFVSI